MTMSLKDFSFFFLITKGSFDILYPFVNFLPDITYPLFCIG